MEFERKARDPLLYNRNHLTAHPTRFHSDGMRPASKATFELTV